MIDPQVAYDKLAGLGSTGAIADYFRAEQILGTRGSGVVCPVARYLHRETGITPRVGISGWCPDARWVDTGETVDGVRIYERVFRPHQPPVAAFVAAFDAGHYPELTTCGPFDRDPKVTMKVIFPGVT